MFSQDIGQTGLENPLNEILIDPVPEETENLMETEEVPEAEQSETKGNFPEPESTPTFEFGLAVAGLATAVVSGAGHKPLNMDGAIVHKLQPG